MAGFKFENSFFVWLSARVSPAQLSTLYSAFTEINNYCLNKRLLTMPLFETDDLAVLLKIQTTIERSRIFAFTHRKQKNVMLAAIRYYCRFIEERKEEKETRTPGFAVKPQPEQPILRLDDKPAAKAYVSPKTETPSEPETKASEIDELLKDEVFLPLRAALAKENIRSIDELKEIKLWAFMNKNNIYTIPVRQKVLTKVRLLLDPPKEENPELLYKLHCGSAVYTGETPAKTFLHFCEDIAGQYPLFFRSVLGWNIGTSSQIKILRSCEKGEYLKMENPTCFISAELKKEEVISAADWIYRKCFKKQETISIDEPKSAEPETVISEKPVEEPPAEKTEKPTAADVKESLVNENISNENEGYTLDFKADCSLAYTKPFWFSYKGKAETCSSWSELYVKLVKAFYFDNSSLFKNNVYIGGSKRVDIGSMKEMYNPKKITDGVFVECNYAGIDTTINKIRWLMKYCSVSSDDVVIKYSRNNTKPPGKNSNQTVQGSSKINETEISKNTLSGAKKWQFNFSGKNYLAKDKPVGFSYKGKTMPCLSWNDLYFKLVKEIYSDNRTLFKNNIYFPYSKRVDLGSIGGMRNPKKIADGVYLECNINVTGSVDKIIRNIRWLLKYCSVSYSDAAVIYGKYTDSVPSQNTSETLQKNSETNTTAVNVEKQEIKEDKASPAAEQENKSEKTSSVAAEQKNKSDETSSGIDEQKKETDEAVLNVPQKEETNQTELADKAEKFVLKADMAGVTYEDIYKSLYTTMTTTKALVAGCKRIVEIKGRFYHEEAFVDWDEGAEQLCDIMEKLMQRNSGYISAAQLYEFARSEMNMFLNDNDLNDERSVYEMAQHLFQKNSFKGFRYTFSGKTHISKAEAEIGSTFDIICKYAEDQGGLFSEDGLIEYLEGMGIKTRSIHSQMRLNKEPYFFMYEEDSIISAKSMNIDDSWKESIKKALDKLFDDTEGHIIIRDIQPVWYEQLPGLPGNISWTPLLLQGVLRFFGEEAGAKTIGAMENQKAETLHTMLVKFDGPIQNFGDAVVSYIVENEIEKRSFEAEELRQLLVESKMIQGSELVNNMPKALAKDERFAWDAKGRNVTIRV